ncbi:TPA: KxYKxGKxW signal peptide domain-containing protein [Streptococcus agalactiae]
MFNKIGFRTWKSGKLWLYMGVLGSTIILGSSPVSAMDSVGKQEPRQCSRASSTRCRKQKPR